MIGYQTAYLKANYPEEFMAALLNSEMSDIERISFLIQEAKQAGHQHPAAGREQKFCQLHAGGRKDHGSAFSPSKTSAPKSREPIIEERARGGPFKDVRGIPHAHPTQRPQ